MSDLDKTIYLRIEHKGKTTNVDTTYAQISTFENLIEFVKSSLELKNDRFKLERKSKRHCGYVKLESQKSFKSLKRSLEVKNTLKLKVYDSRESKPLKTSDKADKVDEDSLMNSKLLLTTDDKEILVKELQKLNVKIDKIQKRLDKNKKSSEKAKELIPETKKYDDEILTIDIPNVSVSYAQEVSDILAENKTYEELSSLRKNNDQLRRLLTFTNGDVDELFRIVEESKNTSVKKDEDADEERFIVDETFSDNIDGEPAVCGIPFDYKPPTTVESANESETDQPALSNTDTESIDTSNFATPSNSIFLLPENNALVEEDGDHSDERTITSLHSVGSAGEEEFSNSGVILANNNLVVNLVSSPFDDVVTDFSEVSDSECNNIMDEYEVLSTDDYFTDDH